MTTYTVLILEKTSVQINDLTPDTTYMFRVQAMSPEGNPGSYSVEHEFHTSALGTTSLKIYRRLSSFSNVSLYKLLFCMCELINVSFCVICTAESQIQNNSTMVMGAVVGVAVILLVVVAVLLLRRRLVTTLFISTSTTPCVIWINVIYRPANCVIMCHKLE